LKSFNKHREHYYRRTDSSKTWSKIWSSKSKITKSGKSNYKVKTKNCQTDYKNRSNNQNTSLVN